MKYFKISWKIPKSPLLIIAVAIIAACLGASWSFIFASGWFDTIWGKILFFVALAIIVIILFAVERKWLLRKKEAKKLDLTKEELSYYFRTSYLIVLVAYIIFAIAIFFL